MEVVTRSRDLRRHARSERAFVGDEVRRELAAARAAVGLDAPDALASLLAVAAEERALDEHDRRRHEEARVAIQHVLRRLRGAADSHALSHDAPAELRDACGFTRVMISRARGSRWFPDTMRVGDGADPEAEEFERFATEGNEIPLGRMLPETRMVREGVAVMVADAASDVRAYKPLIRVTRSTGYVAAPITAGRRVIGFLHADRAGQRSPVTAGDLECIALFTAEFSVLFERAVLAERAESQRSQAAAALREAAAELDGPTTLALGTYAPRAGPLTDAPAPRRDALLTAREREIVELIAAGATNRAVAQDLVVATDTVKTHVSSILRKLDATSRAEAVARYLRLQSHAQ